MRTKQPKLGKKLLSLTIMLTTLLTLFAPPSYAASDGIEGVYPIPANGDLQLPAGVLSSIANATHSITEVNYSMKIDALIYNDGLGNRRYAFPTVNVNTLLLNYGKDNYTNLNLSGKNISGYDRPKLEVSNYTNKVNDGSTLPALIPEGLPSGYIEGVLWYHASKSIQINYNAKLETGLNRPGASLIYSFKQVAPYYYGANSVLGIDSKNGISRLVNLGGNWQPPNPVTSPNILIQNGSISYLPGSYVKVERNPYNVNIQMQDVVQQLPTTLNNAVTNINTSLSNQILGTVQIAVDSSQRTTILSQYGLSTTITTNGVYPSNQGGRYRVVFYTPPTNIDQLNLT